MASNKLKVTISHDGYTTIAESSNLRTVQKCLSLIAEDALVNPPSAEAVALEAAEATISELRQAKYDLQSKLATLEKRVFAKLDEKPAETQAA